MTHIYRVVYDTPQRPDDKLMLHSTTLSLVFYLVTPGGIEILYGNIFLCLLTFFHEMQVFENNSVVIVKKDLDQWDFSKRNVYLFLSELAHRLVIN